MSKKEISPEETVTKRVANRYFMVIANHESFERIRQGIDSKIFKMTFNAIIYGDGCHFNRRKRHRVRVATKTHLKRALELLATNPSQVWLS